MATTIVKDLDYYMSLPYTFRVTPPEDADDTWYALVDGLDCQTWADTYEELLPMIEDAKRTMISMMLEYGDPIPEPTSD
ncbi:MAG: type II toxin-antitoxin system HicB family antitoxin [Anaerolineae bacterium]|nr:type II toxin-antitoxin system HicB family antitoxin [Anaerolineae bacterium]